MIDKRQERSTIVNRVRRFFMPPAIAERKLGYDAVEEKHRRQPASGLLRDEESDLPAGKRRKLVSSTRHLRQSFEMCRWALDKHLDFVADHAFQCRSGDRKFDAVVEQLIARRSRAEHFDVAGRHTRAQAIRLAEACAVIDGDVLPVRLASGHVQFIEGDRVRDPERTEFGLLAQARDPQPKWKQGVRVGPGGRTIGYAVHRRTDHAGFEFEREIGADVARLHAWFDRFDQVRGVSPLAAAVNRFRDLYESLDYSMAKLKVASLFGLVLFRDAVDAAGDVHEREDDEDDPDAKPKYDVDFGRGPVLLDLEPGDKAEFLENKTPATESQEFWKAMISMALKALGIPYSFWDEAYTNFFGSRAALMLYLKHVRKRREAVQDLLYWWSDWQLRLAVMRGELVLPGGMSVDQLLYACSFIPDGVPWWDPSKEIRADVMAIAAGLRTRTEIRRERYGDDWHDVIDELADEEQYILEKRVTITEAGPGVFNPEPVMAGDKSE